MNDISKEEAYESIERISNYCEEIDWNLPENERTGYRMYEDTKIIREYIYQSNNQKTGHWIEREIKTVQWVECSECHITNKYKTHYCPNCGAKMEGE